MIITLNFKPFKLFWINCLSNMILSILTSLESSYNFAALLNDYSYKVSEMRTPNETSYNALLINPMVKYGEKYNDMLFTKKIPLNFENENINFYNLLKDLIAEDKTIVVGVDLFYWIPNSICWNKHHWEHYSFINGFNDEKKVFYVFDDCLTGYDEFEIPEERFIKALSHFSQKPHAYICQISRNIEKFELSINEVKENAKRLINDINEITTISFWELQEKDFIEGHMCDLTSMHIFQIKNRHIANQLLIQELGHKIRNLQVKNSLIEYCLELQRGWDIVKNKFVKIYFSQYNKLLIKEINDRCKYLFQKEIDMWNLFLKYV